MTFRRGDDTLLKFSVSPKQKSDSYVDEWRYGRRWSYPPIPAVWPVRDADPWVRASFTAPFPDEGNHEAAQPCPACGAASSVQANYCSQCGTPYGGNEASFATHVARVVGDVSRGSHNAGAQLVELIDTYTPSSIRAKKGWPEILQFIGMDFAGLATAEFLRGEPATVTPNLTLATAQDLHHTIIRTGRLRPEQLQHAELILRYAPLESGYWGPFKALVKLAPVEDLPDGYAEALARLSSYDWSRPSPPSIDIEDVGFLRGFFDGPSKKTRMYLARRARRDLAALAPRSPDTYARVATKMIVNWDQRLSHIAFAPAYVMLGANSALDAHSSKVLKRPDMSTRRDAHPEIWNERSELAQEIFDKVNNSVEAQTWSYQVLESIGQAPPITGDHVRLALLSTYRPLSRVATAALAARPGSWKTLTAEHWAAVFRSDDDSNVDGIIDALSVGTPRPAAVDAARDFLASGHQVSQFRRLLIAVIFLSGTQPITRTSIVKAADAYVAAVATVINESATKHSKLWGPAIKAFDLASLERLRQRLTDEAPSSAVDAVDEQLIMSRFRRAHPSEAINWITSANPVEAALGWELLDEGYKVAGLLDALPSWISRRRDPSIVARVLDELLARITVADAPSFAKVVEKALDSGAEPTHLAASLMTTPAGLPTIWNLMSGKAGSALINAAPDLVRVAGDGLTTEQLRPASTGQLRFVLRYVKENPARIAGDLDFGLAAATCSTPALQTEAIKQLRVNGQLVNSWLALAESQVSKAVAAARNYVTALKGSEFRDAVLKCLDSDVTQVRDLGGDLLDEKLEHSTNRKLWTALAESDDPRIVVRLTYQPQLALHVDEAVLSDFDRRILTSSRRNQSARELVKARLDATQAQSSWASPTRVATLLQLARGPRLADKEWALGKLAEIALAGFDIEGLDVSPVTTGDNS